MLTYQQLAESSESECDELRTQLTTLNAEHASATAAAVASAVAAVEAALAEQLHTAVTERDVTATALAEALAANAAATAADSTAATISELQRERDEAVLALTSEATSLREEVTSLQAQLRDTAATAAAAAAAASSSAVGSSVGGSSDEQGTAELRAALAAAEGEVTSLRQVMQQQLDEVRN
jgi:trimeric autotransporter adhesin